MPSIQSIGHPAPVPGPPGGGVGVPPAVLGILPNTLLRMPSQRHIPAHGILTIPWAATYDWQGLADHSLGRTRLRHRANHHDLPARHEAPGCRWSESARSPLKPEKNLLNRIIRIYY